MDLTKFQFFDILNIPQERYIIFTMKGEMFMLEKKVYAIEINDGFIVEVSPSIKDNELYEFYLGHKEYGIKMMMFATRASEDEFMRIIVENVDKYIETYEERYFY